MSIYGKFDLRSKLYLALFGMGAVPLFGGIVMIWYSFQMQDLLSELMEKNIAAFQAAEEMETALINQKGFVTYYYLDSNPEWLTFFSEYRQIFRDRLADARKLAETHTEIKAIDEIEQQYDAYMDIKNQIIQYYTKGSKEEGARLHKSIRSQFMDILKLCEEYKHFQTDGIKKTQMKNTGEAEKMRLIAYIAVCISGFLVAFLSVMITGRILNPLSKMLASASDRVTIERSNNIVSALGNGVRGLIKNADDIRQELEKSREHLIQAEKLALVGKLAAGMAHSIRNPFTSVKMRLFSLGRSLKMNADQKEDFDVISHEIHHIDTIVQNFLEFSRPPKLCMQKISPSAIVDTTLGLLSHRLGSYNVSVHLKRRNELPAVMADPEQIREVLVNIMINACEAMVSGGIITIVEEVKMEVSGEAVLIRIADTGPGISAADMDKVFQPFFTTKEDGTGLGLSIAKRIMDEHGGGIFVNNVEAGGAGFVLRFPKKYEEMDKR